MDVITVNIIICSILIVIGLILIGCLIALASSIVQLHIAYNDFSSFLTHGFAISFNAIFVQISLTAGSVAGIIATYKLKISYAFFYISMCLLCAFWYEGTAVAAIEINKILLPSDCKSTQQLSQMAAFFSQAKSLFCSITCYCYFPSFNNLSQPERRDSGVGSYITNDHTYPTNVTACPSYNYSLPLLYTSERGIGADRGKLMTLLEKKLSCSGWCDAQNTIYYVFIGLDQGRPLGACYTRLKIVTRQICQVFAGVGFVMMLVSFVAFAYGILLINRIRIQNKREAVRKKFLTSRQNRERQQISENHMTDPPA